MEDQALWVWQGFEGPVALATAQKAAHDAMMGNAVGLIVPPAGAPPMPWSVDGSRAMFAVQVRPEAVLPCPAGMIEADPALVGRLVGA